MQLKSKKQIADEEKALKAEKAEFHRFDDLVEIAGTGVFMDMPKGKKYKVHKLIAKCLVDKKYATMVS